VWCFRWCCGSVCEQGDFSKLYSIGDIYNAGYDIAANTWFVALDPGVIEGFSGPAIQCCGKKGLFITGQRAIGSGIQLHMLFVNAPAEAWSTKTPPGWPFAYGSSYLSTPDSQFLEIFAVYGWPAFGPNPSSLMNYRYQVSADAWARYNDFPGTQLYCQFGSILDTYYFANGSGNAVIFLTHTAYATKTDLYFTAASPPVANEAGVSFTFQYLKCYHSALGITGGGSHLGNYRYQNAAWSIHTNGTRGHSQGGSYGGKPGGFAIGGFGIGLGWLPDPPPVDKYNPTTDVWTVCADRTVIGGGATAGI
jgi:hypothetical protein